MKSVIQGKLLKLWLLSLRTEFVLSSVFDFRNTGTVIALWHRDLPACMKAFSNREIQVMISSSRDGELAADIATDFGYRIVRGSSSSQPASVRILLRSLQKNGAVGMTLDGPRGPAGKSKNGVFWLSQNTSSPLLLACVDYGPHLRLRSWDRTIIPLPFSKIRITLREISPERKAVDSLYPDLG